MPISRRSRHTAPTVAEVKEWGPRRSMTAAAAAVKLDNDSLQALRLTDEAWQNEAWRMYDIVGELRFVANRHANSLSRARLYVAEVGSDGKPGKESVDGDVQVLAETVFGGPAAKAEGLRGLGLQNFIGGECWIVAEGSIEGTDKDNWYVVSTREIKKDSSTNTVQVKRPMTLGGGYHTIRPKQDLFIRHWTPHPRVYDLADSPVRSTLPVLREIEQLSKLVFSQIDSRLISAGLLLMPAGLEFPHAPDVPSGVAGLMDLILEAAKASLTGAGTAAALVPIMAEGPAELLAQIQHLKFDTPLTGEVKDKLDHALRRLALGLDAPPEVLLGQGSMNHWSAWQVTEDEITTQFNPVLTRICASLNTAWLTPALLTLGKDPEAYTFWYDTAPLTVRPNRFEDALKAYSQGAITVSALADAGAFDGEDRNTEAGYHKWFARELIRADPSLLANEELVALAGLPKEISSAPAEEAEAPVAETPAPAVIEPAGGDQKALPDAPQEAPPAQQAQQKNGKARPTAQTLAASSAPATMEMLLPGAEQIVLRALELAGGRLLDRRTRGQYGDVSKFDLHTRIPVADAPRAEVLLDGAFAHVPALAGHYGVNPNDLRWLLDGYCKELLVRGYPHSKELLAETLRHAVCLRASA